MHVLMVSNDYPPRPRSGIGVHVGELTASLRRLGVEVTVVTPGLPGPTMEDSVVFSGSTGPELELQGHETLATLNMLQRNIAMAAAASACSSFDLVHCHDTRSMLAASVAGARAGRPVVMTKHYDRSGSGGTGYGESVDRFAHQYERNLERWSLQRSSRIIAVSDFLARKVIGSEEGVAAKLSVIRNGTTMLDHVDDDDHDDRCASRGDSDETQVLQVGRLTEQKGCDLAITALSLLEDTSIRLVLVGDGPERGALEDLARELGVQDRVTFKGYVERSRLAPLYEAAEMVLAPSRYDPFPIAVCDAQALGKVVIAADVDGIPEQVEHGRTGLLCLPDSAASLAGEMSWVLREPGRSRAIGRQARSYARSAYSWDQVARATASTYEVALSEW